MLVPARRGNNKSVWQRYKGGKDSEADREAGKSCKSQLLTYHKKMPPPPLRAKMTT